MTSLELDKIDKIKIRKIPDIFFRNWDSDKEIFMADYGL